MKGVLLVLLCIGVFSCRRGYECNRGKCEEVKGGQYKSLSECISDCASRPGTIDITARWYEPQIDSCSSKAYIRLAHSAYDLNYGYYIVSEASSSPPARLSREVKPGHYYYEVVLDACVLEKRTGVLTVDPEQTAVADITF